jgi:hypothetical protein
LKRHQKLNQLGKASALFLTTASLLITNYAKGSMTNVMPAAYPSLLQTNNTRTIKQESAAHTAIPKKQPRKKNATNNVKNNSPWPNNAGNNI